MLSCFSCSSRSVSVIIGVWNLTFLSPVLSCHGELHSSAADILTVSISAGPDGVLQPLENHKGILAAYPDLIKGTEGLENLLQVPLSSPLFAYASYIRES